MKKPSEPHILFLQHSDSGKTDVSECSTNTEDYITCNTDLSKRGIKPPSASSSSTTQMPGSNPIDTHKWDRCYIASYLYILQWDTFMCQAMYAPGKAKYCVSVCVCCVMLCCNIMAVVVFIQMHSDILIIHLNPLPLSLSTHCLL